MFHQVPAEWEIVDTYTVAPARIYVEDDGATIVRLAPHEVAGAYTFDMASPAPIRPPPSSGNRGPSTRPKIRARESLTGGVEDSASAAKIPTTSQAMPSRPKRTRLDSAISFFRTRKGLNSLGYHQRNDSSTSSSSGDEWPSGSGSGSSDAESEERADRVRRSRTSSATSSKLNVRPDMGPSNASRPGYRKSDLKRALIAARGELMKQVEVAGKNALVSEGWSVTVLRQAARYRIRIEYTGRPALVSYPEASQTECTKRNPPFLEVIDAY